MIVAVAELCLPYWTLCEDSIGIVLVAEQQELVLTHYPQCLPEHFEVGLAVNCAALQKFEHD